MARCSGVQSAASTIAASAPSAAEHEPPIGAGLGRPHAHDDDDRRLGARRRSASSRSSVAVRDQRRIAIEHQHVAGKTVERARAPPPPHRAVPSCSAWITVSAGATAGGDVVHPGADHDDRPRRARAAPAARQHMPDHRPVGDVVQHLGERGSHPRALAGGKDQGGKFGHGGTATVGRSGISEKRLSVVTASGRSVPDLRNAATEAEVANITCVCPAMRSCSAGAAPL